MRLNILVQSDLAPYHQEVVEEIRAGLSHHLPVVVQQFKRGEKVISEAPINWIWAIDWKSALRKLRTPKQSKIFASVLSSEDLGNSTFLFWKELFSRNTTQQLLLAHSVHNFSFFREFSPRSNIHIGFLPLPYLKAKVPKQDHKDRVVVGTWMPLFRDQNIHFLVTLAHWIKQQTVSCDFRLLGFGPLASHARELIRELKLEKVLSFQESRNIDDISAFDIFLYLPQSHSTFLPLLMAARHGCAVVTTQVMGIEEYIEHGVNGFIIGTYQTGTFGEALNSLIQNTSQRKLFGSQLQKHIEGYFSMKALEHQYLGLFGVTPTQARVSA